MEYLLNIKIKLECLDDASAREWAIQKLEEIGYTKEVLKFIDTNTIKLQKIENGKQPKGIKLY